MMMLYSIAGLVIGGGVGYAVAYSRYGNTKMIDELRSNYRQLQQDMTDLQALSQEHSEQNRILKQRAQQLLYQNEDFSKMVSELTRYYYRIKQGSEKLKELVDIMGVYDEDMEKKLDHLITDETTFDTMGQESQMYVGSGSEKKYF